MDSAQLAILVTIWLTWTMMPNSVDGCNGIIISKGRTFPSGTIDRLVGQDLSINCTITDEDPKLPDSSDIIFQITKKNGTTNLVSPEYVTIMDNRSAHLFVTNLTDHHTGNYQCVLNTTQSNLCSNDVNVGTPLPASLNFSCLDKELKNMTCKWTVPSTALFTNWTLHMKFDNEWKPFCSTYPLFRDCRLSKTCDDENQLCTYSTDPIPWPYYNGAKKHFNFSLTGQTSIEKGDKEKRYFFAVDHFKIVIAASPTDLSAYSIGSTGLKIKWKPDDIFGTSWRVLTVVYRLEYRTKWDSPGPPPYVTCCKEPKSTYYNLLGLLPDTTYTISVRAKSESAADTEEMWSQSVNIMETTEAAVPVDSVKIVFSGFEDVIVNNGFRNVTIYWQPMQPYQYYGSNFSYFIEVSSILPHPSIDTVILRTSATATGSSFTATFPFLYQSKAYRFIIRAGNSVGNSTNHSEIVVPISAHKPSFPESFTASYNDKGGYILRWKYPPDVVSASLSNTVFWCEDDPTKRTKCLSAPHWKQTNGNDNEVIVKVDNPEKPYRFGVSSDNLMISSGLMWHKCIANFGKAGSKVKIVSLKSEGPKKIHVTWQLDCAYRSGTLEGFVISYCLLGEEGDECIEKPSSLEVPYMAEDGDITNLEPLSRYKVTVAAKTTDSIGEWSDPSIVTTAQDGLPPLQLVLISVGSAVLVFVLVACLCCWAKGWLEKMKEIKNVELPPGLLDGPYIGVDELKKPSSHRKQNEVKNVYGEYHDRLQSISSDAGRTSMGSEDLSIYRASSLDSIRDEQYPDHRTDNRELRLHVRNLSGDSCGCYSGDGSVSSSLTTHTQISSDSNSAVHFIPASPSDSVFAEYPWGITIIPEPSVSTTGNSLRCRNTPNLRSLGEESDADLDVTSLQPDPTVEDRQYCKIAISDNVHRKTEDAPNGSNVDNFNNISMYSKLACMVEQPETRNTVDANDHSDGQTRSEASYATYPVHNTTTDMPTNNAMDIAKEKPDVKHGAGSKQTYVDFSALATAASERDDTKFPQRLGYSKLARPSNELPSEEGTSGGNIFGETGSTKYISGGGVDSAGLIESGNAECKECSANSIYGHDVIDICRDFAMILHERETDPFSPISDIPGLKNSSPNMADKASKNNAYISAVHVGDSKGNHILVNPTTSFTQAPPDGNLDTALAYGESSWEKESDVDLARLVAGIDDNSPPRPSSEGYVQVSKASESC